MIQMTQIVMRDIFQNDYVARATRSIIPLICAICVICGPLDPFSQYCVQRAVVMDSHRQWAVRRVADMAPGRVRDMAGRTLDKARRRLPTVLAARNCPSLFRTARNW